jgi:RNA polymerase sigma-70 factor (ECF subfamily)
MPTDQAELVAAAKDGDREAFEALVKVTYHDAYTLAYRLTGNEEDARDVVQDAYLRAYRGLGRFRGDAQFTTWLYRIVANCASTSLSKRSRHRHDEIDEETGVADDRPESDPVVMAEAGSLRDRVSAALEDLPPKLRAVVVLRDVYDLPHEAIAEELGITEAAAKVRLHRARKKLRDQLFPGRGDEEHAHAV